MPDVSTAQQLDFIGEFTRLSCIKSRNVWRTDSASLELSTRAGDALGKCHDLVGLCRLVRRSREFNRADGVDYRRTATRARANRDDGGERDAGRCNTRQ